MGWWLACEHVAIVHVACMRNCTMDGGKKQPELFRSNLFSPSGGLSLGLSDESFSSPLSLAPALGTAASGTPNSKCALIGTSCIPVHVYVYAVYWWNHLSFTIYGMQLKGIRLKLQFLDNQPCIFWMDQMWLTLVFVPVLEDQLSPRTRCPPGHVVLGPAVPPDI